VNLDRLRRAVGRVVAPQPCDQPVGGNDLAGVEHQHREDCAALVRPERNGEAVVQDLQIPEDPELHVPPPSVVRPTVPPVELAGNCFD
jgi:hypothetical protein